MRSSEPLSAAGGGRWARRVAAALMAATIMLLTGGPAAWADTAPHPDRCDPSNQQDHAGSGMPGWINAQPAGGDGSTLYEQYGWSGMTWSTCQLSNGDGGLLDIMSKMPPMVQDPGSWIDTHAGNIMMGGATTIASFMTQLDQWAGNPGQIMEPIDNSLADVASSVASSTWGVWAGLVIVFTACFVVMMAMRGDVRRAMATVVAILVAAFMVAALGATWVTRTDSYGSTRAVPGAVYLGQAFDHVASGVTGSVAGASSGGTTPNIAYGATLYDQILAPIWAQGAVGAACTADQLRSNDGTPEGQLCYDILRANTTTYGVWDNGNGGYTSVDQYKSIAYALTGDSGHTDKAYDPTVGANTSIQHATAGQALAWYNTLRGVNGGRAALGAKALITMLVIAFIRIPCSLLLLMGLLVVRLVVMFIPIWALFAIPEATRGTAKGAGKMVFAAIYNATVFGVFGAVYTTVVAKIISSIGGYTFTKLLLILALTAVVWVVSRPFRSVTVPATGDVLSGAGEGMTGAARSALSAPMRIAGGVMAVKSYQRLRNIGREERKQTAELAQVEAAESPAATYTRTYASEPPRLASTRFKARNPVKEARFPVKVRTPLDLTDVDRATGEVHARLQNPLQGRRPFTLQSPLYLRAPAMENTAPSAPVLTNPGTTGPGGHGDDPAARLALRERMRQRDAAQQWRPPPGAGWPTSIEREG